MMQRIKGWTEEWEKKRHTKNGAVSKDIFVNKCKDTVLTYLMLIIIFMSLRMRLYGF